MTHYAHIRYDGSGRKITHTVAEHCRSSAAYASEKSMMGLQKAAYLAALVHDMGKYTAAFQEYLARAALGEPVRRGSVNHTFAGVRFVMGRWHTSGAPSLRNMVCELIAVAAGAHHGLFDCIDPEGQDQLLHRLTKEEIGYQEARDHFLRHCAGLEELDTLFAAAHQEILAVVERCKPSLTSERQLRFCLSLLMRLLASAVIEGDRRDTAEFYHGAKIPVRQRDADTWDIALATMEDKLNAMETQSPMDRVRGGISDRCRDAAKRPGGIYRLSVPTGGGKTLSGLRYALAAAAEHQKKHIFFVIPLLSVLEQNAGVIRKFLADDNLVLEHHSNILREEPEGGEEALNQQELLMETWDAPVVITTLVQLLNTLFLGKSSCIRRMHALADSIIVIDEVQSVPRKMLSLFNLAMNFLASACGSTVILCSATQPCLETVPHALHLRRPADLIALDPDWGAVFRRTQILDRRKPGGYTIQELAGFALESLEREGCLLLVCNTKAQARALYADIRSGTDAAVFHLSTSMCMAHRLSTLAAINACLEQKRPVLCVATQLVEAGVDFSFACVIRVSAGLDNLVQAAGRCNRHGEYGRLCPVYIVNLQGENLSRLQEIRQAQQAAESVLEGYRQSPDSQDPASQEGIRAYYRRLYTDLPVDALNYPLTDPNTTLLTLLSDNRFSEHHSSSGGRYVINQAFRTAGREFRVFDDNTTDVLVPYGEGARLIESLMSLEAQWDFQTRKALLDKAKAFTISLYEYEVKMLGEAGGLSGSPDGAILILRPEFYSEEVGLDRDGSNKIFLEA